MASVGDTVECSMLGCHGQRKAIQLTTIPGPLRLRRENGGPFIASDGPFCFRHTTTPKGWTVLIWQHCDGSRPAYRAERFPLPHARKTRWRRHGCGL